MYTVAVPVTNWYPNREMDCEGTLKELNKAGATRVWLCSDRGIESEDRLKEQLRLLKAHRLFFEAHGLEVGVWIGSLGHGGALSHDPQALENAGKYEKIVGLNGETCEDSFCPTGEHFARDYSEWIARIAQTGAKLIMLDDDYRLSLRPNFNGCCCERHMREYCRRVGEDVQREQLFELIFKGKPNKYRASWLDMAKDSLMSLAKRIRGCVDAVDPSVRVGLCAVMSTWDMDGVTALELTKALAGNTRPFLRTIGAPYWVTGERRLHEVINQTRLQRWWCEQEDVELFTEGDAYPRPRYCTPASYLEMFDMALRADGGFDGILKYMMDYTSSPRYERGYIDRMARNAPIYAWIEKHLSKGVAEGADIVCRPLRICTAETAGDINLSDLNNTFNDYAAEQTLSHLGIPMTFGSKGVHVACGEDARNLAEEQLDDGVVLDSAAARILMERGVDIGITAMSTPYPRQGDAHDLQEDEYVATGGARHFYDMTLKDGAEKVSELDGLCSCFRYENAKGQRFMVFAFEMDAPYISHGLIRSYTCQKQMVEGIEWAGRKPLPAVCLGHPDILLLCKRTQEGLAVGLWNLSADYISDADIRLDGEYTSLELFGAQGHLKENSLHIESDIAPYSFVGMVAR